MIAFLLTHVLTLSATEARVQILFFTRIELTTFALVGVGGYLLDPSGDEGMDMCCTAENVGVTRLTLTTMRVPQNRGKNTRRTFT